MNQVSEYILFYCVQAFVNGLPIWRAKRARGGTTGTTLVRRTGLSRARTTKTLVWWGLRWRVSCGGRTRQYARKTERYSKLSVIDFMLERSCLCNNMGGGGGRVLKRFVLASRTLTYVLCQPWYIAGLLYYLLFSRPAHRFRALPRYMPPSLYTNASIYSTKE